MGIWDTLRRFSGGLGREQASHRSAGKQAGKTKSLRRRDLRLEQFEDRLLLSIAPSAVDQDPLWNYQLSQAIGRAANLDHYESLEDVSRWVVGLQSGADGEAVAGALNAQLEGDAPYLANGFIWEFDTALDPQTAADRMSASGAIDYFYPLVPFDVYQPMATPDDVLFGDQWHLLNTGQSGGQVGADARVTPVWDNYLGDGIVIGIVDDSLQGTHPDLMASYRADLSIDSVDGDSDPSPVLPAENHGTSVAGVAGAPINNGPSGELGVAGAAPNAELAGLRIDLHGHGTFTDDVISDVLVHRNNAIDIYNNSWGPTGFLYGPNEFPMSFSALRDGVENGRQGLGNIYVFAAGNGRAYEDNVNYNGWANSRYTIAVAALDHNGEASWYSTPGASLLVAGYSSGDVVGITTTDRTGEDGYNATGTDEEWGPDPLEDIDYTSTFGGTSSASPLVSGVIGLMLEANEAAHPEDQFPDYPGLTYRDVQHILVETARFTDPGSAWEVNAAGYNVSYDYGFGAIDAEAAVQAAIEWVPVDEEISLSGSQAVNQTVPDDNSTGVTSSITLDNTVGNIEWVEVNFDADHAYPGDLEVVLTSPSGTESVLARTNSYTDPFAGFRYNPAGYDNWTFTSARHWGESSGGQWTLTVRDLDSEGVAGDEGFWNSWSVQVYGTENVGFGPELIAVIPNAGSIIQQNDTLHVAPRELTLRFTEGQSIDPATLDGIRIYRAGGDGTFDEDHEEDVQVEFGWIGLGDKPNEVIVRFLQNLPDDLYQIELDGTGEDALLNINGLPFHEGEDQTLEFTLDLGVQVTSVVPQPVDREADGTLSHARRDEIEVYFSDDELYSQPGGPGAESWGPSASAQYLNPEMFQLIVTQDTADPRDDVVIDANDPEGLLYVEYFPGENRAVLKFANNLDSYVTTLGYGVGALRLRIGDRFREINTALHEPGGDAGAMLATAHDVTAALRPNNAEDDIYSIVIPEEIRANPTDNNLPWPGANDEPSHRHLPPLSMTLALENHLAGGDTLPGIPSTSFYFPEIYGADPWGNPLQNAITEAQKERTREIFAMYSHYTGVDFYESETGGLAIVTGDIRAVAPTIPVEAAGGIADPMAGLAIMNNFFEWGESQFGGGWFTVAMHEIGHLLGYGHAYDLPPLTIMGSGEDLETLESDAEPIFPGKTDVIHGRHMFRNDSTDIDLYKFELDRQGVFKAEIMAERLQQASLLDSVITIYRETGANQYEIVARNDDYYSGDSYAEVFLEAGTYYVGISSTGNTDYDPAIDNTGMGGNTEGDYELRLTFEPQTTQYLVEDPAAANELADTTKVRFDGDADGVPGGVYNFWFNTRPDENVQGENRTIYVDKAAKPGDDIAPDVANPDGTLANPYYEIDQALAAASPGDIVRIVGNAGLDDDPTTIDDNAAYEIGFKLSGQQLEDGWRMEVPQGVTVMVDAGSIFKMRRANIDVGSSAQGIDRSLGALQVLGTPENNVYFTSYHDETIGLDTDPLHPTLAEGDWGGLVFRNNMDYDEGRTVLETEGVFLDYVNHADMRYGGGEVVVNSIPDVYNPIHMVEARPTASFNRIRYSADAAMSGDPNSFADTKFQTNHYMADYDRVGPDLHGNDLHDNSLDGVFVRIETEAGETLTEQEVVARWDDMDIVHVVQENLVLSGNPGGPLAKEGDVAISLADSYTMVTSDGSAFSDRQTFSLTDGRQTIVFELDSIPYQNGLTDNDHVGVPFLPSYTEDEMATALVDAINEANTTRGLEITATNLGDGMIELGAPGTNQAPQVSYEGIGRLHRRIDARLAIDPGVFVKIDGARVEAEFGAQLIAEGSPGYPVVFTSVFDDRYGAGGSFDTTGDDFDLTGEGEGGTPVPGDWGGFFLNPTSSASIDQAVIMFGGGETRIEGGFARFNPIEVYQADLRVANSEFRDNTAGNAGDRNGRGRMFGSTIFVRGAMPVVVDNVFRGNDGPVLNIDGNSMEAVTLTDPGRSTGLLEARNEIQNNHGPLIRGNRFTDNEVNGMVVRGAILNTETVWDDTDITHVVSGQYSGGEVLFEVPNHHHLSGLRLQSNASESLVVKLDDADAGFLASGWLQEVDDRIGGTIQVIGTPQHPVVLTSLADDTVGAGFDIFDQPQTDTNNDGAASVPAPGDWNSIRLERYSNDRNVAIINELEPSRGTDEDVNGLPSTAEYLGELAADWKDTDDNLREGFHVNGFIRSDARDDADVYSFHGTAGTEVWIDIDHTTYALDSVVELVDANGIVISRMGPNGLEIARSDNSLEEEAAMLDLSQSIVLRGTMESDVYDDNYYRTTRDFYSMNPRDAGMRVILPGPVGEEQTYFVRVRSAGGETFGAYQLQLRLREMQELPGSTVRYADVRYATNGVELHGQPIHSPLVGESYDRDISEVWNGSSWVTQNGANNDTWDNAQDLGNVLAVDRNTITVGGNMRGPSDVDWFKFSVDMVGIQSIAGVNDMGLVWPLTFDVDYADGLVRPDTNVWVFNEAGELLLVGSDSNVAGDRPGWMEGEQFGAVERGSLGAFDPFIGDVYLPEGNGVTYYVAVTTHGQVPEMLGSQPLLRREPVNSVDRVREDHLNLGDAETSMLANPPTERLFGKEDAHSVIDLNAHADPWHLGDVVMYVNTNHDLHTLDPFTGAYETDVTGVDVLLQNTNSGPHINYRDIAMRNDGLLYSTTSRPGVIGYNNNTWAGRYRGIDTGDGSITVDNASGIITYQRNPQNPGQLVQQNSGLQFEAIAHHPFDNDDRYVYAVGGRLPGLGVDYEENLLYLLDSSGQAIDHPDSGGNRLPTNIVPLGHLRTNPMIQLVNATDTQPEYDEPGDVYDGLLITIVDDFGSEYVFEMNAGQDVEMGVNGAADVRDGEFFWLQEQGQPPVVFEFNSGPVIDVQALEAATLDGYWFELTDNESPPNTVFFEFDNDGNFDSGREQINFAGLSNVNQLTQRILEAINGANLSVNASLNPADATRITLTNDTGLLGHPPGSTNASPIPGINFDGAAGLQVDPTTIDPNAQHYAINFEETQADAVFGANIERRVEDAPLNPIDLEASFADRINEPDPNIYGDRLTFLNAVNADFSGVPTWNESSLNGTDVEQGNIEITFEAEDTSQELASAIRDRVDGRGTIEAELVGGLVSITDVLSVDVEEPLTTDGSGPGGDITGMAFVDGDLFVVTDRGGLFEVEYWNTRGFRPINPDGDVPQIAENIIQPTAVHIATLTRDGENIPFSGLAVGPQNVEEGAYADMLFAVDDGSLLDGSSWVYAMDTTGAEQGIFLDAASSMPLEVTGAQGIDFSNIDYNLWHVTNRRGADAGHGVNEHWDTSRNPLLNYPTTSYDPPDTSFYFGLEDPRPITTISYQPGASNYISANSNSGALNTYDVPGGAYGTLTTNPFSLVGYDRTDLPTLYVNYYLHTEQSNIWDAARIYASTDNASWSLLGTSTNIGESDVPGVPLNDDGGVWRQARISLAGFAGQEDIRLRFVFDTASDLHVGSVRHTGAYLAGVPGVDVHDGDTFIIDTDPDDETDQVTFEFNMGHTVSLPDVAGTAILDGQYIDLTDAFGNTVRFEFDKFGTTEPDNVPVLIADDQPTSVVLDTLAQQIAAVVQGDYPGLVLQDVEADVREFQLRVVGANDIVSGHLFGGLDAVRVRGNGLDDWDPANHVVNIHHDFTPEEVAEAVAIELDVEFSGGHGGVFTSSKLVGANVHLIGHMVYVDEDEGPQNGPLPHADGLLGDHPMSMTFDRHLSNGRGQNNRFEGFYIDDIIVGFAERGETVTGTSADFDFVPQGLSTPEPVTRGDYQLEIRRSDDYGIWNEMSDPQFLVLTDSYDTNDRLENGITLEFPGSAQLQQGDTFSLSDGVNAMTFELVDRNFVGSGTNVPIKFDFSAPEEADELHEPLTAGQVANAVAAAINDSGLDLTAHSISTSGRVDIFGATWADTPTDTIDHIVFTDIGDTNLHRDQGYTIIESNRITHAKEYGILVDSGTRDTDAEYPHPGSPLPLREKNTQRWVPGMTIENNVIAYNDMGGIHFSGDTNPDGTALAAVPFGAIVNNTLYGKAEQPTGTGILVSDRVSPTILNNIVANFETGIEILEGGNTSVVGATIYQGNDTPRTGYGSIDNFERFLGDTDPLFVDASSGDFYLKSGSQAIDSSIDSLVDREEMVNVRGELGFSDSPILAPSLDVYGQLRIDDPSVTPPPGLGNRVFKDRGAIDRVDFIGPTAWLIDPKDNDGTLDRDPTLHHVSIAGDPLTQFAIELRDLEGIGINDGSVTADRVTVYRDSTLLALGIDYLFSYDQTNDVIRLLPAAGIWLGTEFTIRLDNSDGGIRDLANNPLQPNTDEGYTEFKITMAGIDYGDAPDPTYPTLFDSDGARHILSGGYYLGEGVSSESEATPNADADGDDLDDGVVFDHALVMGSQVAVTVTASRDGFLDGWIDFDDSGSWNTVDDPSNDEWVFRSEPVTQGENTLIVDVPPGGVERDAFARFRFRSTADPIGVTGEADDGEVEDYKLPVVDYLEDFGDAPSSYRTTRAADGAVHKLADPIDSGLFLGDLVDSELDGVPSSKADSDDKNGPENDEDGVRFVTPLVPGRDDVQLQVRASGTGYLNGWVDYNGDGAFDVTEHLFDGTGIAVDAGVNDLLIEVPPDATEQATYARFRLSSEQDLDWYGPADDGEVEDYRVEIIAAPQDFGDAPEPMYPTTLAANGARHEMIVGFQLGNEIDFESDGQPTADATGDDSDTFVNDEDGVQFLDPVVPGRNVRVQITSSDPTGYVNGWIDWDRDGWGTGANDQFLVDQQIDGTEIFNIPVPLTVTEGDIFARFRLSHTAGLSFDGPAEGEVPPDGEVEDYRIEVVFGNSSISGRKYNDRNANGQIDLGEGGVAGVTVYLMDADGNVIAETETAEDDPDTPFVDETGEYVFAGLFPNEYGVAEEDLVDWIQTYPNEDITLPGGVEAHADGTYTVDLGADQQVGNIDFLNYRIAELDVLDTAIAEGNSGVTEVEVTFRRTESFGAPVTVKYETRDGTGDNAATLADDDYHEASGTFEFPALDEDPPATWDVVSLTANQTNDYDYHVWGEHIVWESFDGNDWEIFLQEGLDDEPTRLTNNGTDDRYAFVYGSNVLWSGFDGNDWEIYHYDIDTGVRTRVTDNAFDDKAPQASDTHVTWWGDSPAGVEVYLWEVGTPAVPMNISNNAIDDIDPRISGDKVVWYAGMESASEIYLYDAAEDETVALTADTSRDRRPVIDGSTIVWEKFDGADYEIYYQQIGDAVPTRLTVNTQNDSDPQVSGDYIVWQGYDDIDEDFEIYYHNLGTGFTENLSDNDRPDEKPAIDGTRVVWRHHDGEDWEVFYREIGSQLPASNVSDNDFDDWVAEVSETLVVWRGNDSPNPNSNDIEVYAATVRPPEQLLTLTLEIVGDLRIEPDEVFFLDIFDPELAEVVDETAAIGILNDDGMLDYGDALEADYPTLLANNGARHVTLPGYRLGDQIDTEGNGQPNVAANGDDRKGLDDEDGVTLPSTFTIGADDVPITVSASGAGVLDAWIDFNRDGDWDDAGERVFDGQALSAGDNLLSLDVPANSWPGESYARFRFSLDGVDSYSGTALSGEVEDYQVALREPVQITGQTVEIDGTPGDDHISVKAGELYTVTVNDVVRRFYDYEVDTIVFNGGAGANTAVLTGSERNETVSLWPDHAVLTDGIGGVRVEINEVTQITANSGGGEQDLAKLYDSPGRDYFRADPNRAEMRGLGYSLEANGFAGTVGYSQSPSDVALLYDSPGDDHVLARPLDMTLQGDGFSNRAMDFMYSRAFASTGNDEAEMYGGDKPTTLDFEPELVRHYSGRSFNNSVYGFSTVTGYAQSGRGDVARFYGGPGQDVLEAHPGYASLTSAAGDYAYRAEGFAATRSFATPGDGDVARLYGSAEEDVFAAVPETGRMFSIAGSYDHKASGFAEVTAYSGGGADWAKMTDSAGSDVYTARPGFSQMTGVTDAGWQFSQIAEGFARNVGSSVRGGGDVAYLHDSPGNDQLHAEPNDVVLQGLGYLSRARHFSEVKVEADSAGNDTDVAYLYDSAMEDLLEADDDYTRISSASYTQPISGDEGFLNWAIGFEFVEARTSQDQADAKEVSDAVDFLVTLGNWRDS